MLSIVPPPPPSLSTAMALGLAGLSVAVGAAMLLWGRLLHRSFLAIAAAAAGVIAAEPLAKWLDLPVAATGVVAILGLAVIGAVAARIIWALAGGAVFALVVLGLLLPWAVSNLSPTSQPVFASESASDFQTWATECHRYVLDGARTVWAERRATLLWAICLGGGVPMVALLLLPRLGKIFMTSLVGAVGVTAGLVLAVSRISLFAWPRNHVGYALCGGIALVLLIFSLVFQYCTDVAQRQAEQQDEDESPSDESDGKRSAKKTPPRRRKHKE